MNRGAWPATVNGVKELNTTVPLSIHTWLRQFLVFKGKISMSPNPEIDEEVVS